MEIDKLNHFTTFDAVIGIIKTGLRFSTGQSWEDKNDLRLLELYRKITNNQDVKVLCFLNDDETIYHWKAYQTGKCSSDICCIEFDKKKLLSHFSTNSNYICEEVQYATIADVEFDNPRKLLFTKRWPYRNEKEFRIVQIKGNNNVFVNDAITRITLSQELCKEEYNLRVKVLKQLLKKKSVKYNQSTIMENEIWINKAELGTINKKGFSMEISTNLSAEELKQFRELVKKGGQVKLGKSFDSLIAKGPVIALIKDTDQIVAIGGLKIPNELYKKKVFENSKSELNPADYSFELGWIFTMEEYRHKHFCESIIAMLLSHIEEDVKVYATTREDNSEYIQKALRKYGFKQKGNSFLSDRRDRKEDYNVCLFVRNSN